MRSSISLDDVSVLYGHDVALSEVSVEIPTGRSVAVIGPNGSGKSTLLKVVAGVLRPTSGTVDLGGQTVAVVLQSTDVDRHVPLSVEDTVRMARYPSVGLVRRFGREDQVAVDTAVADMALSDLVRKQIHQLSGGQRQRTFVAQGLAQGADVLALDEPMTGLDAVSQQLIGDALTREIDAGRTTIMTTHSFAEAERCDLVLLLSTGVVAFGTPDEVLVEANMRQAFGGRFVRAGDILVVDDPHHHHVG